MNGTLPPRRVGLEYLSVFGLPLAEYVAMSARLGFDFVSVNWRGAANALDHTTPASLQESKSERETFAIALSDFGMRLELVEGFAITPDTCVESLAPHLDAITNLGAQSICVVSLDKDLGRTIAQYARLADLAEERTLTVTTEVGAGVMRNIHTATATWDKVSHSNFKLLVDAMHFFRSGGTKEDLQALPDGAIGHAQLCDVPMPATLSSYMEEALFERRCPGDGVLPLKDFLTALSDSVPVGLEVPIRSTAQNLEVAVQRCVFQARKLTALVNED